MVIEKKFHSAAEQANYAAEQVAAVLTQLIKFRGRAVLAVSGGRSPIAFFTALSQQDIAWEQVIVTLVDERVIATNHADSNTALVKQYLMTGKAAKADFSGLLADDVSVSQLMDYPRLAKLADKLFIQPDVVVLGMGEDGHTASLFPHVADLEAKENIIAVVPEHAPYARLSLSLNAILNAQCVFLNIGGAAKMAVYQQAKDNLTADLPISYVLNKNTQATQVLYFE